MIKKLLSLLLFVIFMFNTGVSLSNNDDEARIIGIHYPKSYDVKRYHDKANGILNVVFKVHLPFPSKEVLKYYNDKLKEIGWTHFYEPYYIDSDREWQKFIMWPAAEGDFLKYQLLSKWINKDKNRMLLLTIVYYSRDMTMQEQIAASKPNNDVQEVALQFMPFTIWAPPSRGK